MAETFDAKGEALCCAAVIRLGGATGVLAARADLTDGYRRIVAGVENIAAFLEGHPLDRDVVSSAFAENWFLDGKYPAQLPGRSFFKAWSDVVFVALALTLRDQPQISASLGMDSALRAASALPSSLPLRAYELACQQEAEVQLRASGVGELWGLAGRQAGHYRRVVRLADS
ncbi:hypothetical protein AB0N88_35135 [Streptomyces sp. NPDC093516]|uniref:hypothetical protein n=1 Tax=Streptomyces sp. NPDC093516 TaxID=3155304 RepID=UPI00343AA02A